MYGRAIRRASLEFTVYIIIKVYGTGYLEKRYFFTRVLKNICFFLRYSTKKKRYWVVRQNNIFLRECKKKICLFNPTSKYLRYRIVGRNTFANKTKEKICTNELCRRKTWTKILRYRQIWMQDRCSFKIHLQNLNLRANLHTRMVFISKNISY